MAYSDGGLASGYILRITVVYASQNAAANQSTVNWSLVIHKGSGSGKWNQGPHYWSTNIGGATYSGSIASYDFRNYSALTLASGSTTLTHRANGTLEINASGAFSDNTTWGAELGNANTGNAYLVLPTINRAATAPTNNLPDLITRTGFRQTFVSTGLGNGTFVEWQLQRDVVADFGSPETSYLSPATSTSKTYSDLPLRSTHYTRVRAVTKFGTTTSYGAWSATRTLTLPDIPDAPTLSLINRTSTTIQMKLTDPAYSSPAIEQRRIQISTSPTFATILKQSDTADVTWTAADGLVRGTQYYTRAAVRNAEGWSPWAVTLVATLVEKPSVPTGYFVSDIATTSGLLNLSLVADTGGSPLSAIKFEVMKVGGAITDARETTSYSAAWIKFGSGLHQVRMAVKNSGDGAQWSDWGAWVTFNPSTIVPDRVITANLSTATLNSLTGYWGPPTNMNGATPWNYRVRLSTNPEMSVIAQTIDLPMDAESHLFTGLQPGTDHYMQVYVVSSNGSGSRNVPSAHGRTLGTAPEAKYMWMLLSGTWRPGVLQMKLNGLWRPGVLWQRINGQWRKF